MYFHENSSDQSGHLRFAGFSEPSNQGQFQKSVAAIDAALKLNPVGGYVKGSLPRRKLEESFESVPRSSALELGQQLIKGEGPVGKLFRYRIALPTQQAMLQILMRKAKEFQQQEKEELRRKEEKLRQTAQRIEEINQKICENFKRKDILIEEVCRRTGESSDQCRKLRSEALQAREQFRAEGSHCP